MQVHIGIVTWNRLALTKRCLESLLTKTQGDFTCTVVDNGSCDGTVEYLSQRAQCTPKLTLRLLSRNMGVSVASNLAWDAAKTADFFIKLDNDVEIVDPLWLCRLLQLANNQPSFGPLGYQLYAKHTGAEKRLADGTRVLEVPCCNGACACIPRALHEQLGFWNEGYGVYGYEDLEYSWRALRVGFTPVYLHCETPALLHHGEEPEYWDPRQEAIKKTSRTAPLQGTKAYLLHLFLFEQGLLPLKMVRKYLPSEDHGSYRFTLNPRYKTIQRLLKELVQRVEITQDGDLSRLDLRAWQRS
ncbi:MAG: glycosyltransferase family 2 protein [Desulfovibrio sp.]|nr:glycosyltransferase family 2 protein [Desulfovibrio sp.]